MQDLPDPPKPSSQRNAMIQIGLIILAVIVISIWNSRPTPSSVIDTPEVAVAPAKAAPATSVAKASDEGGIGKMLPEEYRTYINEATRTTTTEDKQESLTGSPERQEFIRSCLASLTEGEEPAVMSVSPAEREAMCAAMYTAR